MKLEEPLNKNAWKRWYENKDSILEQAKNVEVETLEVNFDSNNESEIVENESSGDRNGFHKRTMLRSTVLLPIYMTV